MNESKKQNRIIVENATLYQSVSPVKRLHLRLQGKGAFGKEDDCGYGTLMHGILSEVKRMEDLEGVIDSFVRRGELSEAEATNSSLQLRQWLDDERVKLWFAPDVQVWNEQTILKSDGTSCRPDRIVELPNGEIVVIDYKFGNNERDKYIEQVADYVGLILQMGYSRVSGVIWYVTLGKIVPVL